MKKKTKQIDPKAVAALRSGYWRRADAEVVLKAWAAARADARANTSDEQEPALQAPG